MTYYMINFCELLDMLLDGKILCPLVIKFIYLDQNYLRFYLIFDLLVTQQGRFICFFCNSVNSFIYFETMFLISIYTWLLYIPVTFLLPLCNDHFFLYDFFHINPILSDIKNSYFWLSLGLYLFSIYFSLYFQLSLSYMCKNSFYRQYILLRFCFWLVSLSHFHL